MNLKSNFKSFKANLVEKTQLQLGYKGLGLSSGVVPLSFLALQFLTSHSDS